MKFGIVVFPGSNCDDDMHYTLREVLGQEAIKLWHKDASLHGCDFIVLPGGFSYGDYLRSGAIARFSPVMASVVAHAAVGGQVLGICNGFQILTEAGLLPGALLRNTSRKYVCKNVFLKPVSRSAPLTQDLDRERAYQIPIAHGDGRYYAAPEILASLNQNDQVLFHYCEADGQVTEAANPNGSAQNIAGVCNLGKNVFGMMPHPERATSARLGNADGREILEALLERALA